MTSIYSTAYLPSISYFLSCIESEAISIDIQEHFVKQSYRNRCTIAGPNGKQSLIVPLIHNDLSHTPIKEVKISYDTNWNIIHHRSIITAYSNAPFFEYFGDQFNFLIDKKHTFLIDLNMEILEKLLIIFRIKKEISFTTAYSESYDDNFNDLRTTFHPKKVTEIKPYHQVFADKNGFLPDLSILDYLFNCGIDIK